MKPSNFLIRPWDSVLNNFQSEIVALNIMKILARTDNIFRELSWEEYHTERLKDGDYKDSEKEYFDRVISYCTHMERACLFSPDWTQAYVGATKASKKQLPLYTEEQILSLLETLRIKLGLYSLYDNSYPAQWIKDYLK